MEVVVAVAVAVAAEEEVVTVRKLPDYYLCLKCLDCSIAIFNDYHFLVSIRICGSLVFFLI